MARFSQLGLKIRLSRTRIEYEDSSGKTWYFTPHEATPPANLRSESLFADRSLSDPKEREAQLHRSGVRLGQWLIDEKGQNWLADLVDSWSSAAAPYRVELRLPKQLVDWPWEIVHLEGIGHWGTQEALTVVRTSDRGEQPRAVTVSQVRVDLVAPAFKDLVATDFEIDSIREEIETASADRRFHVQPNYEGIWSSISRRYRDEGPPDVFHFAGHGLPNGEGLSFLREDGSTIPILAPKLAQLLSRRNNQGRKMQLAFLNACNSSANASCFQPFGGLAHQLIEGRIPMVVGFQAPVGDQEACRMASAFYAALAQGHAVDCALQRARTELYYADNGSMTWAFVTLMVSGTPQPLFAIEDGGGSAAETSASDLDFGFSSQRQELENLLQSHHPLVIVLQGERYSGHRHLARQLRRELERRGRTLWKPVTAMRWFVDGEPLLSRSQLLGGIARAFDLATSGPEGNLIKMIAKVICSRCETGRVVVVDLEELIEPRSRDQAGAILTLVEDVWLDLMEEGLRERSTLSVFLILSVAYPRRFFVLGRHFSWVRDLSRKLAVARSVLLRLATRERLERGLTRVKVLAPLEPFSANEVAKFLDQSLFLPPDEAEEKARFITADDNDTTLDRLTRFIEARKPLS